MAITDIDPSLVTTGNPVEGACVYTTFAASPTYPTDASTALGTGWESLGEVSDNGYSKQKNITTTDHRGWHGSVVLTTVDEETNTLNIAFIEPNRPAVAKLMYGKDNVTAGSDGSVSNIEGKAGGVKPHPIVIDELESNGFKRRTCFYNCMPTSFDEEPHRRGELLVYGFTFTAQDVTIGDEVKQFDIWRAAPSE